MMDDVPVWKQMRHRVYRNLDEIFAGGTSPGPLAEDDAHLVS